MFEKCLHESRRPLKIKRLCRCRRTLVACAEELDEMCRGTVTSARILGKSELIRAFIFWGIREECYLPPGSPWSKLPADLIVMPGGKERERERETNLVSASKIMFMFIQIENSYFTNENILVFCICTVEKKCIFNDQITPFEFSIEPVLIFKKCVPINIWVKNITRNYIYFWIFLSLLW